MKAWNTNNALKKWILDDVGEPIECDLMTWAHWFELNNRLLKQTRLFGLFISTVFLGLDHSFGFGSRPTLWETMIFGLDGDQPMYRYSTRDQAMYGHKQAIMEAILLRLLPHSAKMLMGFINDQLYDLID